MSTLSQVNVYLTVINFLTRKLSVAIKVISVWGPPIQTETSNGICAKPIIISNGNKY